MSSIISYGYYFPHYQVADKVLNPNGRMGKHSVSYIDEDIITLAYEAANRCLENQIVRIDAVFFATTTPVFENRYHASFLANALDLGENITAFDFGATPRAGTDALMLAHQLVDAGVHENILVVASEIDYPEIGEEDKSYFGHAACAFLIGNNKTNIFGEIKYGRSFSSFVAETFIYKGKKIALDARFSREAGFKNNMQHCLELLKGNDTSLISYDTIVLNSHYAKMAGGIFVKAGFNESQFARDNIIANAGYTGVCHALLSLIDSLENKKKSILLFDYFNGTNVLSIESNCIEVEDKLQSCFASKKDIETYQDYLKLRKVGNFNASEYHPIEMFSSEMMNEREKDNLLYLKGYECDNCKTVYFIKSARCKHCKGATFSSKKLQRTGTAYSLTREHYFPSSFPPITMVVIDLDGGGRVTLQLTDDMYLEEKNKVFIGSKVKLVWRKMVENGAKPDYFFKAKAL